jgi:parvulin-like peptidyl-prolyl isomerase
MSTGSLLQGRQDVKIQGRSLAARKVAWLAVALAWAACTGDGRARPAPAAAKEAEAGIVAKVNGEPVARAEWRRMLTAPVERAQLVQELGGEQPDDDKLGRLALEKLIHRRLLLQEAARRGFDVTEKELDAAVASLRSGYGDLRSFGAWMQERGLDDNTLFDTIRAGTLVARVRAALVEKVRVTDEEVRRYHRSHEQEVRTEEARLQIIVVDSRATAAAIMAELRNGKAFAGVARKRSLGARAAQGGDTGWVEVDALPPPLREVVGTLEPRQAVGPVQRGGEFLVVRLGERRPGRAKGLAEARPDIERRLLPAKQQETVQRWLAERERKSDIEVLLP